MQERIAKEKLAGKTTSADTTLPKSDLAITLQEKIAVTQTLAGVTGMQQGSYPKQDISKSVDFLRQYGHGRGYYYSCRELPETLPIFYADPIWKTKVKIRIHEPITSSQNQNNFFLFRIRK